MTSARIATGIFKTPTGYRAFVWVPRPQPNGRVISKRFKKTALLTTMKEWRVDAKRDAKTAPAIKPSAPKAGFAGDAAIYLAAVRAMPSYKDRVRHIADWVTVFGDEPIAAVTPVRIRAQRDRWLTVGPQRVLEKAKGQPATWVERAIPLSASSVNHRLRALENFFTVLYPTASNPVRHIDEVEEPAAEPRGHSFAIALEILSFMPDVTTPKKDETPEAGSLSRARFEAMLWTGMPAVQLGRLKPDVHIDWTAGTYLPPRRQKGKHSRRARRRQDQPRPLLPQAVAALKRFFALGANRHFSSSSLGRSVARAIRAANKVRASKRLPLIPEHATVYDLTRHTFGTEAMRASQNLKAVQNLMGHADINQTARYAMAAVTEGTATAIRQLAAAQAGGAGRRRAAKPQPSTRRAKPHRRTSPRAKSFR